MRKRSILKQSKCHSVATNYYINDSAAGIYIWPYTQEGNHVIDPDTQMDTFYPDNPGLDLVDPTQTQGVRTLTDLYLQAKFKPDLNSADVHCIGLLIKYNDHMGSTPFASQTWTGLYIDSDPTLATTKLIYSGPSFATESSVIAVVNFGTDNDTVQTSYIPGPILLDSGDRLIWIVKNIEPVGTISFADEHYSITPERLRIKTCCTLDYNISF